MSNLKKFGFLAVLGAIVAIPIAIWKSSKIGKVIFIFAIIGITGFAITKISTSSIEAYSKFKDSGRQSKLEDQRIQIHEELIKAEQYLLELSNKIKKAENDFFDKVEAKAELQAALTIAPLEELIKFTIYKTGTILKSLEELEASTDVIRKIERKALKERIFVLNEKVKIHKKDVESIEIKSELELVASNINLLTEEERDRLFDELEEIGFSIKRQRIRAGREMWATASSIGWYN